MIFTKLSSCIYAKYVQTRAHEILKKTFSEKKRNQPEGVEKWPFR